MVSWLKRLKRAGWQVEHQIYVDALRRLGCPYAVIGGFAVAYHGHIRATIDLDILVGDIVLAEEAFADLDVDASGLIGDRWTHIPVEDVDFDIFTEIPGVEALDAFADAQNGFLSLDHLIAAKHAAGRYQDLADLEVLQRKEKGRS